MENDQREMNKQIKSIASTRSSFPIRIIKYNREETYLAN